MGDTELNVRMQYHTQFDEKNTEIVTALISETPEAVKPVLSSYNVNKVHDDYKKEIVQENTKDVLLETAAFLKVKPKTKHISTIANSIVIGIQNFLHEFCENCKEYYAVAYHETPALRCQNCGQGCHEVCYAICKHLPGIEWSCSSCNTSGIQVEPTKDDQKEDKEKVDDKQPEPPGDQKYSNPEKISIVIQPDLPKEGPVCKFFLNSRCKYGVNGQNCKFRHLKVCRRFLNNGIHKKYGCNLGRNCQYHHPKMCHTSLFNRVCTRENCKFSHVNGTKHGEIPMRNETDNARNHQHQIWSQQVGDPLNSNTNTRSNSEEHFLGIAAQLQQQLAQMQHQQQFMMTRLGFMGAAQAPQPQQPQLQPQPPHMQHQQPHHQIGPSNQIRQPQHHPPH